MRKSLEQVDGDAKEKLNSVGRRLKRGEKVDGH